MTMGHYSGDNFTPQRVRSLLQLAFLAIMSLILPQQLHAQELPPPAAPSQPTVTFTFDFPQSNPSYYSIAVDGAGHAHYSSKGKVADGSEDEPYRADFEMSAATRERIFALAKQADYFAGNIDSGNNKLAFTGTKSLGYQDTQRSYAARYNYSKREPVRELTALFQNIGTTLEFGRRLAYYLQYQKLALDEELKNAEAAAQNHRTSEIQSIAPVLQAIVNDASIMKVARARAEQLLNLAATASALNSR